MDLSDRHMWKIIVITASSGLGETVPSLATKRQT
jgi:hypothetical protein